MNSFWSWIFLFGLYVHFPSVSSTLIDVNAGEKPPSLERSLSSRALHVERSKVIGPIVGGVVGGVVLIALMIYGYLRLSRRKSRHLEDGPVTPQLSGREWYNRFKKSGAETLPDEKTPLTAEMPETPLSAVPRYLKPVPFGSELSPADRPLPPSPAHPRSPRALPSTKGGSLTLTVPSPSPTGRSPSRRKMQVAPQPVVLGPNGTYGTLPNSAGGRKRTLLPNLFKPRPADRNPRIPPGFDQLHPHEYNQRISNPRAMTPISANLQSPYTPRSASDMSIEDDIADLPVKTPRMPRFKPNQF